MHRIDGPGATVDNKFTDGDPVSAVEATTVTDDWLNAVQEELIGVIADAAVQPPIPLEKANNGQLALAIKRIVASLSAGTQMRRITRLSSATVQAVSGANVSPQVFSPLSYSFTADGGMYDFTVKLNANIQTTAGTGAANAVVFKLLNGATVLDISSANIAAADSWTGDCFILKWSGPLSGPVTLTVTFEKTYANGSLAINGDRDDLTSNVSGQISSIEIWRAGV